MIRILLCSASAFDRLCSAFLGIDLTRSQVDSKDSLENVESKWVGEIAENCQGAKLVLVALKCDLRETGADGEDDVEGQGQPLEKHNLVDYTHGLEVARRIQALRYLGMRTQPSSR